MNLKPCSTQIEPEALELTKSKNHIDLKSRADLILQSHPAIQHVAIIDYSNTIVECKGKETFSLPLSRETMTDFARIEPLLILGATEEKLRSSCGRVKMVVGLFEKALLVIYQLQNNKTVVLVLDSVLDMEELREIATFLEKMDPT